MAPQYKVSVCVCVCVQNTEYSISSLSSPLFETLLTVELFPASVG